MNGKYLNRLGGKDYLMLNFLATDLIEMKVKLLTRLGLQEFSKIFIPELPGQNILFVAARAIKKDGTVIEMDMDDMEKMDFSLSNANDKEKVGEVRFSIPNTAVDDVVEIVYMVKRPYFNTSETAMLASYLPAMKSTFNLAVSKGTRVDYRQYNGVYPPALIDEDMFWDRYTPGFYVDKGQIPVMEVPFLNKVVLSNFGYEGYLAYARSNFETPLDTGFVLPPSAENLFLVFYDEDNEPHFIFPRRPRSSTW